jgi:hypothetical protein
LQKSHKTDDARMLDFAENRRFCRSQLLHRHHFLEPAKFPAKQGISGHSCHTSGIAHYDLSRNANPLATRPILRRDVAAVAFNEPTFTKGEGKPPISVLILEAGLSVACPWDCRFDPCEIDLYPSCSLEPQAPSSAIAIKSGGCFNLIEPANTG